MALQGEKTEADIWQDKKFRQLKLNAITSSGRADASGLAARQVSRLVTSQRSSAELRILADVLEILRDLEDKDMQRSKNNHTELVAYLESVTPRAA